MHIICIYTLYICSQIFNDYCFGQSFLPGKRLCRAQKGQTMLNYIESRDNAKIKNAVKISQDAKYRRENGVFFASTRKVVCDIIDAGFEAVAVFALESEYEKIKSYTADIPVYVISRQVCETVGEQDGGRCFWRVQNKACRPG